MLIKNIHPEPLNNSEQNGYGKKRILSVTLFKEVEKGSKIKLKLILRFKPIYP